MRWYCQLLYYFQLNNLSLELIAPALGEIPRSHSGSSRVYKGKYLQLKYTFSTLEKFLVFALEQGPRGIVG